MNFLKRELAPFVDEAWSQIETEAVRILKNNLSARQIVDFVGPMGFDYSAVNLGTLAPSESASSEGIRYGIRRVLPLVEVRVPFQMDIWDLDNLARGASTIDSAALVASSLKLAAFEERAIYNGFAAAGIVGIAEAAANESLVLGADTSKIPDVVTRALLQLSDQGVSGPYALVLGSQQYRLLSADSDSYPLRQRLVKLIGGPILHSSVLEGGFLVSQRGGDFELTVGQDISIGYHAHDSERASLYLTESFTFRVLGPEAAVPFKP